MSDIIKSIHNNNIDSSLIAMSRFGYVKPLVIEFGKGTKLIIDNAFMYLAEGNRIKIIAYWDKGKLVGGGKYEDTVGSGMFKKLSKSMTFISQHRRFMAPFGLAETNIVKG